VLYLATCQPADDEMRERVRRHQAERPASWITVEPGVEVAAAVEAHGPHVDGILLDCLTLYVSGLLMSGAGESEIVQRVESLCLALQQSPCPAAMVTNEVGSGLVPGTPLGRQFRDVAGRANQAAARQAQEVVLLVSGIPVVIKGANVPSL
jgi:adenosylcobinamide kinase/adenosylcobinamide-phosphate guanylyltransferase